MGSPLQIDGPQSRRPVAQRFAIRPRRFPRAAQHLAAVSPHELQPALPDVALTLAVSLNRVGPVIGGPNPLLVGENQFTHKL